MQNGYPIIEERGHTKQVAATHLYLASAFHVAKFRLGSGVSGQKQAKLGKILPDFPIFGDVVSNHPARSGG